MWLTLRILLIRMSETSAKYFQGLNIYQLSFYSLRNNQLPNPSHTAVDVFHVCHEVGIIQTVRDCQLWIHIVHTITICSVPSSSAVFHNSNGCIISVRPDPPPICPFSSRRAWTFGCTGWICLIDEYVFLKVCNSWLWIVLPYIIWPTYANCCPCYCISLPLGCIMICTPAISRTHPINKAYETLCSTEVTASLKVLHTTLNDVRIGDAFDWGVMFSGHVAVCRLIHSWSWIKRACKYQQM